MQGNVSRREFLVSGVAVAGAFALPSLPLGSAKAASETESGLKPMMKLGCCAYSYRKYLTSGQMKLEDFLEEAARLGLDGVQLTTYYYESTEPAYLHRLKFRAYRLGLDIPDIATRTNFCQKDLEVRIRQAEEMKKWIDAAVELGANGVRVFGGEIPKGASPDEAVEWTVDGIRRALEYAEKRGVILALENHGGVTETADLVLKIRSKIDSPNFALLLDTANFRRNTYEEIKRVAPYAVTTHVKTEVFAPEGGKRPVDTEQIIRTLAEVGYRGYLHIEYEAEEEPRTAIPRFVAELRATVNKVLGS
ncbi:MAG: sugar phosphate isomerase/epimerase [candidate division KSB1 bacterium]|nr:sugar phosphate isomerase/epimerase [candidate division KSB1 bacterium]